MRQFQSEHRQCRDAAAKGTSHDQALACSPQIGFSSERNRRPCARGEEGHRAPSKGGSKPQQQPKAEARGSPDSSRAGLRPLPQYAYVALSQSNFCSVFSSLNPSRRKVKCQVFYTIYLTYRRTKARRNTVLAQQLGGYARSSREGAVCDRNASTARRATVFSYPPLRALADTP